MLYWLFTDFRAALSAFFLPLLCLAGMLPLLLTYSLGIGIQRRASKQSLRFRGWRQIGILTTFVVTNLTIVAVYTSLLNSLAVRRSVNTRRPTSEMLAVLVGGPATLDRPRLLTFGVGLMFILLFLNLGLWQGLRNGGWLRERIDRWRKPYVPKGAMGSAHFCTSREYRRYRQQDREGVTLLGAFWGRHGMRLDFGYGRFCLNGEDAARGVLVLGRPGSGKTAAVILPVIADRMDTGHSLIIADPQGELTPHILRLAKCTGHIVIIHDPTSGDGPRFNLAEGIASVSDARAIADVLVPAAQGDNRFWSDSAAALLAACLIRFDNLGDIYNALKDLKGLAASLAAKKDDAALLANSFIASVGSDGRVASNVVATLATALTGWASIDVRANTSTSDFHAALVVQQPTVVVLTCPGRHRAVYASYLGATLRKLMLDLDTIGEQNKGPLPMPVGIILDEFPTLGKLDGLVADVNLVRKRRISILIAAQTKGQFHLIYGEQATKALFSGLATQIVYGACDYDTADFYSKASGTATADANPDPDKANLRQRSLLTTDEIINPQYGNSVIFSSFVETNYALQVILYAELTRFYEREDWKERIADASQREPLVLGRGNLPEASDRSDAPELAVPMPPGNAELDVIFGPSVSRIEREAVQRMNAQVNVMREAGVEVSGYEALRQKMKARRQAYTMGASQ